MSTTQQRAAQRIKAGANALRIKQFNMRYSTTIQKPPQVAGKKRSADALEEEKDVSADMERGQKRIKHSDVLSMPGAWPEDVQTTPEHADRRRLTPTAPAKKPSRIPVPVSTSISKPSTIHQSSVNSNAPSSRRAPSSAPRSTPASRTVAELQDRTRDAHRITKPSTPSGPSSRSNAALDRARRLQKELQAYRDAHALNYKQTQLDVQHAEEAYMYWRNKFERKSKLNFNQSSSREDYTFSNLEVQEAFNEAKKWLFALTKLHPKLEKLRREAESGDCLREVKLRPAEVAAVLTRAERKRPRSKVPVSVKVPTTTPSATDCAGADTLPEPECTPAGESVACVDKTTSTQTPEDPREPAPLSVASAQQLAEPVNEEVPEASRKVDDVDQSSQVTSAEQGEVSQVFLPPASETSLPVNGETSEAPHVIDEVNQSPQATSTEQIQISQISQQGQQQAALPLSRTPEVEQTPAQEPVQVNLVGDAVKITSNGAIPTFSSLQSSPISSEYAHAMLLYNHLHHFGPYGMEGKGLLEKLIFDPTSGDMVYFIARGQEVIGCRCGQEMLQHVDHNEEKSDCAMNIILNQLKDVCQADWEKSLTMDPEEGEMLVKKDMEMMIRASTEFADSVSGLNDYKNRMVWAAYAETVQTSLDKQYNPQAYRDRQKAKKASMREIERQTRANLDYQKECMAHEASLPSNRPIWIEYTGHGVEPMDETVYPATEPPKVHNGDADDVEIVTDVFCGGCNEALDAQTMIKPKEKIPAWGNVIMKCRCNHINVQYPDQLQDWIVLEDYFPDDKGESSAVKTGNGENKSQSSTDVDEDGEDGSSDDEPKNDEDEGDDPASAMRRLMAGLGKIRDAKNQTKPESLAGQSSSAGIDDESEEKDANNGWEEPETEGGTNAEPTSVPNHQSHTTGIVSQIRQDRPCGGCNSLLKWFMNDCWLCEPHKATPEWRQRNAHRIAQHQRALKRPAEDYTPREAEKGGPPPLPNKPVQNDIFAGQMQVGFQTPPVFQTPPIFQTPPAGQPSNDHPTEPDQTAPDDEPETMDIDDESYYSSPTVSGFPIQTPPTAPAAVNEPDEMVVDKIPPTAPPGPKGWIPNVQQTAPNKNQRNPYVPRGNNFGTCILQKPNPSRRKERPDGDDRPHKVKQPKSPGLFVEEESDTEMDDDEQEQPAMQRQPKNKFGEAQRERGRQRDREQPVPRSGGDYLDSPRSPSRSRDRGHNGHNDHNTAIHREGPSRSDGYNGQNFDRRPYQDRGESHDPRRNPHVDPTINSYDDDRARLNRARELRNQQQQHARGPRPNMRNDDHDWRRRNEPVAYPQVVSRDRFERLEEDRRLGYSTPLVRYEPTRGQQPARDGYEADHEQSNQTRKWKGKGKAQYTGGRGQSGQNWSRRGQDCRPGDYTRAGQAQSKRNNFTRAGAPPPEDRPKIHKPAPRRDRATKKKGNEQSRQKEDDKLFAELGRELNL